ncbi:Uncharacterised protein [Halioglobus japonicus]|nr:Uncharacterised protein [Halioglobus japonicus]
MGFKARGKDWPRGFFDLEQVCVKYAEKRLATETSETGDGEDAKRWTRLGNTKRLLAGIAYYIEL